MATRVKSYRINTDENVRKGDAIVIGDDGEMTGQHLGTAASLDNGTCPGNVPILDSNGKLPDSLTPTSVMKKCVYDKCGVNDDAFDYNNFYNTPTIPEVYDPTITFVQGGVNRGSISLNQASGGTIELMAGGLDAGVATGINNNAIDVNVDETSVNVNNNNKLCVVDYDTIKSGAAAGATAVQENDLATVAMTGNYCDLINKPEIPSAQIQSDWAQTNVNLADYIKNKPTIGNATITLQKNGTCVDTFTLNQTADKCLNLTLSKSDVGLANVDNTSDADKPVSDATLCALACKQDNISDLNTIRSNACAGKTASETIANYGDIVSHNVCEFATATQGGKADSAVQPGDLCTVATTGCYCDLTGKPTIGSATITIQKNGTCVDTFNTNATTAKCINITMDKTDVGLANVDNTSDINKPVSTATQAALDCKQDVITDLATICSNASAGAGAATTIASYGDIVTHNTCEFASCAQGAKADTAVQPSQLCTVATTGKYCDLTGTPLLCAVATSAQYCDLLGAPSLCTVAMSGKYCDLSGTPALCTVATSGKYCDLSGLPTIPTDNCQLSNSCGYTTCIGTVVASDLEPYAKSCDLKTVATSGKYCDLTGTPTIPTDNCQLLNGCGYTTCTGTLVSSDLNPYAKCCDLKTVATTGKYCDLTGKPTIPTDNCQLANSCGYITNAVNNLTNYYLKCETYQKCEVDNLIANFGGFEVVSTLPTTNIKTNVIYLLGPIGTGSDKYEEWIYYNNTWTKIGETTTDLSNYAKCCDIPTNNNQLSNGCGYTTCTGTLVASDLNPYAKSCTLCTVATSGKYCDLTGKPTIPTDNCQLANSCGYTTCTGTLVANDIANLAQCCDIPTDNCQLSNSCGYTTCTGTLVASDLNPYAKSCTLCTVATSGKYCDLTGKPTIPTNNNQLTNGCGYTTCTGTLVASDLQPYAKSCDLKAVATSGAYCDLTGTPTIPTDNCQLANSCGYTTCTGTLVAGDLTPYAKACTLCTVATSGKYCDLTGKPSLATVATSGKYCDLTGTPDLSGYALSCNMVCSLDGADNDHYPTTLAVANALGSAGYGDMLKATYDPCNCAKDAFNYNNLYNKPSLATVATSGKYCDLTGIPSLATVATSGCYNDLTGKPTLCAVATSGKYCDISGTPSLATVATTGCYNDLTGKPTIPTKVSQLTNDCNYIDKDVTNLTCYTPTSSLATVATSGAYCDLTGKPSLACVACSGCYDDLTGKPNLGVYQRTCNMVCTLTGADDSHYPTAKTVADALSACGAGDMLKSTYDPNNKNGDAFDYTNFINTPNLCAVATSGKYCDLTGTPTIPSELTSGCATSISSNKINVNYDGTTIKKNSGNCLYVDFTGYACGCDVIKCKSTTGSQTVCTTASGCTTAFGVKSNATSSYISFSNCAGWLASIGAASDKKPTWYNGTGHTLAYEECIPTDNCQLSNSCGYTTCTGTLVASDLTPYAKSNTLCAVATSGKYCDLTGSPSLATVATSGCYCDLTGTPTIPTVNTKTFTLSSTSDTTNASAAAAYINGGDNAIILLSGQTYYLTSKGSSSMVFKSSVTSTGGTSDTELKQNTLTFTVSGNTVTAISNTATSLGKYLQTDKNYGTAYTPLYNGSPATKKYVDDCVGAINSAEWGNITGTMSCQTDLTNALACKAQCCDIPTNNNQLTNGCGYTTCTGTLVASDLTPYACSCDVLTKTNTNSYSPTADYNPATKKYVDDAVAGAGGGDMCYADFSPVAKSGASVTLDLFSTLTPSANFTVNKPSTVKAGQVYVLRVTNGETPYTMSLGTGVENPFGVDLVLTPNGIDQFTFYGTSSSTLELQKDYDDENIFVTQDEYENLPSTKLTDNKTYFIYEEE